MPVAFDPAQTVPFSLAADHDKPEESRPTFLLRYLTCRQVLRFEELIKSAIEPTTTRAEFDSLVAQAAALLVARWKNMPLDTRELGDLLTENEMWELAIHGLRAVRLSDSDKKKSASPPDTGTGKSAPDAASAPAAA